MNEKSKEILWTVKSADGSTFGPASIASLKAWAKEGRLAANQFISNDGKTWKPVTSLPELEMDWVAEVNPGVFYGPIHRNVLDDFIRAGSIKPTNATFVRRDAEGVRAKEELAAVQKSTAALRKDFSERVATLESQLEESAAKVSALETTLSASKKRGQSLAAAEARIAELERSLADETQKIIAAENTIEELRTEVARQKKKSDDLRAKAETLRKANVKVREDLAKEVRGLLEKLSSHDASSAGDSAADVEEGEVVSINDSVPPRANVFMDELEKQAQNELRKIGKR